MLPPKKDSATLADVAERAGVNKVTASVVLNQSRGNTRVSAATRERILSAARELQYRPNSVARSLRRRRTNNIGFYSGYGYIDAASPFLSLIIAGLRRGCEALRKDLLIHGIYRQASVMDIYNQLSDGMVDGLVLFSPPDHPLVPRLQESHLPVVAVVDAIPGIPSAGVDDAEGAALQAAHLAEKGHRHVLYQGPLQERAATAPRRVAFQEAAAEQGMRVTLVTSEDDVGSPAGETRRRLADRSPERPTAIACWNDTSAYRTLAACLEQGVEVPADMSVVGFDGLEFFVEPVWKLSTVRAPWRDVAHEAVTLLCRQIEGESIPERTTLPIQFFAGNTT